MLPRKNKYHATVIFNDMRIYMTIDACNLQEAFYAVRDRLAFHNMSAGVIEHLAIEMSDRNG